MQYIKRNKRDTIEEFKGKLEELRKKLKEALFVRIDNKLDQVLERDKKRILEGKYTDNYFLIYFY